MKGTTDYVLTLISEKHVKTLISKDCQWEVELIYLCMRGTIMKMHDGAKSVCLDVVLSDCDSLFQTNFWSEPLRRALLEKRMLLVFIT